jgi:hypothetical protein
MDCIVGSFAFGGGGSGVYIARDKSEKKKLEK